SSDKQSALTPSFWASVMASRMRSVLPSQSRGIWLREAPAILMRNIAVLDAVLLFDDFGASLPHLVDGAVGIRWRYIDSPAALEQKAHAETILQGVENECLDAVISGQPTAVDFSDLPTPQEIDEAVVGQNGSVLIQDFSLPGLSGLVDEKRRVILVVRVHSLMHRKESSAHPADKLRVGGPGHAV